MSTKCLRVNLYIQAVSYSETSVSIYQPTRGHTPLSSQTVQQTTVSNFSAGRRLAHVAESSNAQVTSFFCLLSFSRSLPSYLMCEISNTDFKSRPHFSADRSVPLRATTKRVPPGVRAVSSRYTATSFKIHRAGQHRVRFQALERKFSFFQNSRLGREPTQAPIQRKMGALYRGWG